MSVDLSEFLPGPSCAIRGALDALEPEQAEKLTAALAHPDVQTVKIVKVLKSWGHQTSESTVRRHRKNDCSCG